MASTFFIEPSARVTILGLVLEPSLDDTGQFVDLGGDDFRRTEWTVIQLLSPPLRYPMRGCVWEEDGRLAGITIIQRRGSTEVWVVGTVGVLPAYRRQGTARRLVEAALDLIRERGGKKIFLDVIDGNVPAYRVYESLGV